MHPTEVVLSAAALFVDRAEVQVEKPAAGRLMVVLSPKPGSQESAEELAARFREELIWETLRLKIARRTGAIREMILGRALLSAQPLGLDLDEGPAPWEDWPETSAGDDYLEDPLGIAVPWEERHAEDDEARLNPPPVEPGRSPEDLVGAGGEPSEPNGAPTRDRDEASGPEPAPEGSHGPKQQ